MEWCTKNELLFANSCCKWLQLVTVICKCGSLTFVHIACNLVLEHMCSRYFAHCLLDFLHQADVEDCKESEGQSAWWSLHVVPTSNWCKTLWSRFALSEIHISTCHVSKYLNVVAFPDFSGHDWLWFETLKQVSASFEGKGVSHYPANRFIYKTPVTPILLGKVCCFLGKFDCQRSSKELFQKKWTSIIDFPSHQPHILKT